eukprot:Ihof_evm2s92 gene=Ihof_evmTU2s92
MIGYYNSPGIGCPPEVVCRAVLDSENVRQAMNYIPQAGTGHGFSHSDQMASFLRSRRKNAEDIINTMAARHNLITIAALRLLYMFGLHVDDSNLDEVRAYCRAGPTVFVPTHKSHVDYLLVLYVCFDYSLDLPCVVSGDNLNMPLIGSLLRHCGALFIRRSFANDPDPLYSAIFREYLKQLLVHGHSLEVFIEGGRSRSGKVLMPKTGVLQSVVGVVLEGHVDDVILFPIALSFDRIVESESHIAEMGGANKNKEQLMWTLQSISSVMTSVAASTNTYGSVDIMFGRPLSAKDYISEQLDKLVDAKSKDNVTAPMIEQEEEEGKQLVESRMTGQWKYLHYQEEHDTVYYIVSYGMLDLQAPIKYVAHTLGYQVLYECNEVAVVLPASLLATVLLSQHQRGIYREELIAKVFWLSDEIKNRGGKVAPLSVSVIDDTVTLVLSGMVGQNELVKRHKDRLMISLYNPHEHMELTMYRNQLIHHFIREAILSCSLYSLEQQSKIDPNESPPSVEVFELQRLTRYLTQVLQFEFVFRPSVKLGINEHFERTMSDMLGREIIRYTDSTRSTVCVNDTLVDGEQRGTLTYLFLCSLCWPFIDSYFIGCLGLFTLLPNKAIQDDVLLRKMQDLGETLYFSGIIDLYEAIAKTTLENTLSLFIKWRVLVLLKLEGDVRGRKVVQLHPDYQSSSSIEALVFDIAAFRKKSR